MVNDTVAQTTFKKGSSAFSSNTSVYKFRGGGKKNIKQAAILIPIFRVSGSLCEAPVYEEMNSLPQGPAEISGAQCGLAELLLQGFPKQAIHASLLP